MNGILNATLTEMPALHAIANVKRWVSSRYFEVEKWDS